MLSRSYLISFVYATSLVAAASQKCYSLTGTLLNDSFAPCNPTARHSGCCATNKTSGADICLDSGLCTATQNEFMGTIWQNGCTDSTGNATECPQLCPGMNKDFDGLTPVSAWNIQTCDFGTYCCRGIDDRHNCCNNSTAPRITTTSIGAFQLQTSTAVSSSTSSTSSAAATATSLSYDREATLTSNADVCKSEKHKTTIIGSVIGGVLGTAMVCLLGVVYWMAKREQRQRKLKEHYEKQFAQTWAYRKALATSTTSVKTESHHEEFMEKSSGSEVS
ncbi:uncharacterized protein M421DRAFT_5576 [Didymella exigua CBS 183.55]|uniref:Mid2 domain-containing protein n=1 Tax=Didymella exigua CBS 183.55 TaxID=1150837 RepID=A0A6A5RKC6_9PLEO|nr:uncharacterized protein M421DRAFT_5576 [Didymella exigua CBS 183.55]KAF1927903.1 hypothetical protein M421DRAFT_5576 [Didymella exigua CBS 183.55]